MKQPVYLGWAVSSIRQFIKINGYEEEYIGNIPIEHRFISQSTTGANADAVHE